MKQREDQAAASCCLCKTFNLILYYSFQNLVCSPLVGYKFILELNGLFCFLLLFFSDFVCTYFASKFSLLISIATELSFY